MGFCPADEDCHFDDACEHLEKDEGAESGEGIPHSAGFSGIAQVVKNLGQGGEGADVAFGILGDIRE